MILGVDTFTRIPDADAHAFFGLAHHQRDRTALGKFGRVTIQIEQYLTDTAFIDRTEELAASSPALVRLDAERDDSRSFPNGQFELTQSGREVLSGAADRLRLCGIDRWIGGVHLTGRGPSWRWNAEQGCVTIE